MSNTQLEGLLRLADVYADASFNQGLARRHQDTEPERARGALEAELRRLHALNAELLEALQSIAQSAEVAKELHQPWCGAASGMVRMARAAIAKGTGGAA